MRIAIYSHSIAPSIDGVCRRFTTLMKELVSLGHEVLLFTLEEDPEDLPKLLDIVKLDHFIMPAYPEKKVAQPSLFNWMRINSALRKYSPNILHVTSDGISHLFALAACLWGVPIVGSFHTDLIDLLSTHNAFTFQKWSIMFKEFVDSHVLDSCAATSTSFARKLSKHGLLCEHIILTGVDTQLFSSAKRNEALRNELTFGDNNAFLCVYVGRISKEKRMDVIVDAVREIPGAYLAIIGDGPTAGVYAAMHGKENRIYCKPQFLSHKKLATIYASSDLHVSASEFETLGNTVLEAFSCSIPVVVPHSQGFCDTVVHGVDGFLFTPGDKLSARKYIVQLKNDPQLRLKMGKSGRENVTNRSLKRVVEDLLMWYNQGMRRQSSRGFFKGFIRFLLLIFSVPFAIVCISSYLFVVRLMGIDRRPSSSSKDVVKRN